MERLEMPVVMIVVMVVEGVVVEEGEAMVVVGVEGGGVGCGGGVREGVYCPLWLLDPHTPTMPLGPQGYSRWSSSSVPPTDTGSQAPPWGRRRWKGDAGGTDV